MLSQALQYPFRGKGSFRLLLVIVLLQFLPVVGQLMLLGYELEIVRAVYTGQTSLPPLRWRTALGDGLLLLLRIVFVRRPSVQQPHVRKSGLQLVLTGLLLFGDQPFWGRRVYELGVGPKPVSRRKLTT